MKRNFTLSEDKENKMGFKAEWHKATVVEAKNTNTDLNSANRKLLSFLKDYLTSSMACCVVQTVQKACASILVSEILVFS